jgi:hypothetical protein
VSKVKVAQQQRDNALGARYEMWPGIPPENVAPRLGVFQRAPVKPKANCGTVACFGGFCALWPPFKKQGIKCGIDGAPAFKDGVDDGLASHAALRLFGHYHLFYPRGGMRCDEGFVGTDHELVTHRLDWLLANSEVAE